MTGTSPPGVTASRTNSVFADDGTATRTLLLAYATFMLAVAALILFLRARTFAALVCVALMLIPAMLLVSHVATRRPFTSSVLCLTAAGSQVRGWIESNLRAVPAEGFAVRVEGESLDVRFDLARDAVQRRGETLIIPFTIENLPPGTRSVRVTYGPRNGARTLGRFTAVPPRAK